MAGMVCTVGDMVILDAGDPGEHISPEMISAHMLNLWSMPDSIVEAVLTHREPVMPEEVASETPTVAGRQQLPRRQVVRHTRNHHGVMQIRT